MLYLITGKISNNELARLAQEKVEDKMDAFVLYFDDRHPEFQIESVKNFIANNAVQIKKVDMAIYTQSIYVAQAVTFFIKESCLMDNHKFLFYVRDESCRSRIKCEDITEDPYKFFQSMSEPIQKLVFWNE